VTLLQRIVYVAMLTASALLFFYSLVLALVAGVSPILSGNIIYVNNISPFNNDYHFFPILNLAIGQVLSTAAFLLAWGIHPTRNAVKIYLALCGAAWIVIIAIALILYVSLKVAWAGFEIW
jgi:hypothetical protein